MSRYIIVLPKTEKLGGEFRSDIIRALSQQKTEFESGPEGEERTYSIWTLDMADPVEVTEPATVLEGLPESIPAGVTLAGEVAPPPPEPPEPPASESEPVPETED